MIKIINLSKEYKGFYALKDINLTIPRGKIIGLLGKNGTGKSTLIKLINDLLTPDSGNILVNGKETGIESKEIISYLPERTYLDKSMTVERVINYFEDFYWIIPYIYLRLIIVYRMEDYLLILQQDCHIFSNRLLKVQQQ